jgi:hypothetical protein
MKESKPVWICLRCGHKWIDNHKAEPRYCPMCLGCTIYVPKKIKIPNYRVSNPSPIEEELVLHFNPKGFYDKNEVEAIAR